MELCTPSTRSSFGSLIVMCWALGCMILPGLSYLIRPWRYLQAAITLSFVILILASRFLPESPRWLLLHGRSEDAENILTRIAVVNHRNVPSRIVLRAALTRISNQMGVEREHLREDERIGERKDNVRNMLLAVVRHMLSPFSTIQLAFRMCVLIVLWILVACAYYGISLNATNISADPYLYIFLGGLFEVFAYLMLWLLVTHAGRRPSLCGLYFICGLCITVNASLMFAFPSVSVTVKIVLSLLGKMAIAAAFHLVYIYTAELFTTTQRSLAVCYCCFVGRIGSIASPFINDILGETAAWAPSAVFAVLALVSSILSLLLPETLNQNLPENNHDLTDTKGRKKTMRRKLTTGLLSTDVL